MRIPLMVLRHVGLAWSFLLALVMVFHADGVRADWVQDLEADAVTWMAEEGCPGMAITIVKNDVAIYTKGFGHLKSNDPSQPVNEDSVFIIGSTSKAFCSAQMGVLADKRLLNWNDPVVKLMQSFEMYDPWVNAQFQVEDLLYHRSGLYMFSLTMMEVLDYPTSARVRGIGFQGPTPASAPPLPIRTACTQRPRSLWKPGQDRVGGKTSTTISSSPLG